MNKICEILIEDVRTGEDRGYVHGAISGVAYRHALDRRHRVSAPSKVNFVVVEHLKRLKKPQSCPTGI